MPPCYRSKFRGGFSMLITSSDKRENECQQCQNEHSKSHQIFKAKRFLVHQHHPHSYVESGLGNSEPLKNQCFRALFFFFYLNFYSFFCIFFSKISLTYLPVCAACFVALPGLKARPLIDNIFPFHISIKGGSAHVKALAVSSGIFTLPA